MLYLDASLLTALVSSEARSERSRLWLNEQEDNLLGSEWGLTEVASALSIKQRTGTITAPDRARADRLLDELVERVVPVSTVTPADFSAAARMCAKPFPPLRAADALHLAIAVRHDATLHTLDEGQAAAGRAHGIDAVITVERG